MTEADADLFFHRHFHDLFHFRQYLAIFAAQAHAFVIRMTSAAPESVRGKCWKPDHFEIWILQTDTHIVRAHAETHADAAVNFHAIRQLATGDHVVDMALSEIGRGRANVPVILERNRAHAAL